MLNTVIKNLFNKSTLILYAIGIAFAVIFGLFVQPFYLHFLDGMTYAAFAFLLIGIGRWAWIKGDFTFFTWHPNKKVRNRAPGEKFYGTGSDPASNMSYRDYRAYIQKQREDAQDPFLFAGLVLLILNMILAILY